MLPRWLSSTPSVMSDQESNKRHVSDKSAQFQSPCFMLPFGHQVWQWKIHHLYVISPLKPPFYLVRGLSS